MAGDIGGQWPYISSFSQPVPRKPLPPCSLYDWFITLLGHTGQKQQPLDQQWWLEPEMHLVFFLVSAGNNFQLTGCTIKQLLCWQHLTNKHLLRAPPMHLQPFHAICWASSPNSSSSVTASANVLLIKGLC